MISDVAKKALLAVAVCTSIGIAAPAMAVTGTGGNMLGGEGKTASATIHASGVITSKSCNVRPFNTNGTSALALDLGTVDATGSASAPVEFVLQSTNDDGTPCDTRGSVSSVKWGGPTMGVSGFSNMSTTNTNASKTIVKLMPVDGSAVDEAKIADDSMVKENNAIITGNDTVKYKTNDPVTDPVNAGSAFKFKAQMVSVNGANLVPGDVLTDMTYTVIYQ
ncbi:hypothetical protein RJV04_005058 [Salmonella enterica]|nr:hypothetical protein [Salmonella enterica]